MDRMQIVGASVIRMEKVQEYLVNKKLKDRFDRGERMPYGEIPKMAKEIGCKRSDITTSLHRLKVRVTGPSPASKSPNYPQSYTILDDGGLADRYSAIQFQCGKTRDMPKPENGASETMCHGILDVFPRGGGSAYAGTPQPLCASNHPKTKQLLDDNLKIYNTLQLTSNNYPIIFIGNIVDDNKARNKGHEFKALITSHNSQVNAVPLDAPKFYQIGRDLALHYNPAKIVFQSGGIWSFSEPTQKKFDGWNLNFQAEAHRLVNEFPNLHILAMVRLEEFTFRVIYMNKIVTGGEEKTLDNFIHPTKNPVNPFPQYEWIGDRLVRLK